MLPALIDGRRAELPPGSCNLYRYPRVCLEHVRKDREVIPALEQLYVLEELVSALILAEEPEGIAELRDVAGATPLHGMLVANTKPSLSAVLSIYRRRPALLPQSHTLKVFAGENALHILAVNKREADLCECIEIAAANLSSSELQSLFWQQASGVFFADEPMAYYGSTPISYAVAFSLQDALRTMLRCAKQHRAMQDIIDFNDPAKAACRLTGMLPVHVAVANSLTSMFNFLVDLPGLALEFDDMRARPDVLSQYGARTKLSLMLPLQVAAKLGDKKLVQYILRTQSKLQWEWGPVASYNLDLNGIDSIGETGNDVMELCARLDACAETQEMLLDDFMAGLLNDLFMQKFYGRSPQKAHYLMRLIDAIYILSIYALAVWLRENPDAVLYPYHPDHVDHGILLYLPYVTLASIVPLWFEDLRVSMTWWRIARSGAQDAESKKLLKEGGIGGRVLLWRRDMGMLIRWMQSHNMWSKVVGWVLAIGAMLGLIVIRTWEADDERWDASLFSARDRTDVLLMPLSFASFLHVTAFFSELLFQVEGLGVFYKTVFMMLRTDVKNWVVLFSIFLLNYGMVMYITYPRFSPELQQNLTAVPPQILANAEVGMYAEAAPQFLRLVTALQALTELAFIGEVLVFDLDLGTSMYDDTLRGGLKLTLFLLFYAFYLVYIVMSLVLLLNLLIAMMGDTYADAKEHATREYRVNFARRVLRLELQLLVFSKCGLVTLNCGDKIGTGADATWVHNYRNYKPNAEGGGTRGAKRPMFEEEVEKVADMDEQDDDGPGAADPDQLHAHQNKMQLKRLATNGNLTDYVATPRADVSESSEEPSGKTGAVSKLRKIGRAVVVISQLSADAGDVAVEEFDPTDGADV